MTSYLLDTNHIGAIRKKNAVLLQRMSRTPATSGFGICVPSIAELWYNVFFSAKIQENQTGVVALLAGFPSFEFAEGAAEEFGRIKAELRRTRRPIPDFDIQIAAIARVNGLTVLTADAHFNNVSNLKTENGLV